MIRLRKVDNWPMFQIVEPGTEPPARVIAMDGQSDDVFRWEASPKHNDRNLAIAAARTMTLPCIVRIQRLCSMQTYQVGYGFGMWLLNPV